MRRSSTRSSTTDRRRTRRWRIRAAVLTTAAVVIGVGVTQPASATPAPPTPPSHPAQSSSKALIPAPQHKNPATPKNLAAIRSGYGDTPAQQKAIAAAAAKASSTGQPVAVDALTSETQRLIAQPNGGMTLQATPGPVRTKQHGQWVPISTTLHHNSDGTWSPQATAYGTVRFSNGGTGPLAITSSNGLTYQVSWPTRLPTPTVTGTTATYHDALGQGIDLVVSATDTGGFADTLVITTAKAAANPALATLKLATTVTGGTQHAGHAPDGVTVSGHGATILESSTPQMWDSATTPTGGTAHNNAVPDRSDTAHPGLAAHIATIHTSTSPHNLTLTPDTRMLHDPATMFPVYLDPTLNWHLQDANAPSFDEVKSGSPCNGASYWNNTGSAGNYGQLGVGYNGWSTCVGIERAMYQWSIPTVIWGATIHLATVNAREVYAAQCTTTSTINLHETGGIGSGTDWNNKPGYTGQFATSTSYAAAANPDYCPNNSDVTHAFTVTSRIATAASQHWSQWTIALTDDADESSHNKNGFKRFADNPVLAINYDRTPATPSPAVMSAKSGSTNAACATATPYPVIGKTIATNPPTLNTTVTDPDGDKTRATFQYWVDGSSPPYNTGQSADNLNNNSLATYSLPTSFTSTLTNGQIVDWQVQVTDGLVTSGWSTVCHFTALPTGPDAPIIQPNSTYPDTSVLGGGTGAASGTPATWQVAGATSGAPATSFVYGLDQPPATVVAAPAGRWKINEGSGTTLADTSGNNHPATATNTTWTNDPTLGTVATFNGTSSVAATSGPVLNTSQSFSVSTWAKVTGTGAHQAVISQDATTVSGLKLETNNGYWVWVLAQTDNTSSQIFAVGPYVTLNTWTHLVGVYDATAGTMSLYADGALASSATFGTRTWTATGPLTIGRTRWNSAPSDWFQGSISDVRVYQRALTAADVTSLYTKSSDGVQAVPAAGTVLATPAAQWKANEGTGSNLADASGNNHPATATNIKWTNDPMRGNVATFDGTTSVATTSGPVLNTSQSFSVSAWVNMANTTSWNTIAAQEPGTAGTAINFYLQYNKTLNAWTFIVNNTSTGGSQTSTHASSAPTLNTWTHLVGVHNATSHTISLYVNGTLAASTSFTTPWNATGAFDIGHAGTTNYFPGMISDVQTYQRALTATDIATMYSYTSFTVTPLAPGPHTLYVYGVDAVGDVSANDAYPFIATGTAPSTCTSLRACFNNTAISPDDNPGLGHFDSNGDSYSATELTNAGWGSGGKITIDGAPFTLPAYGAGQPDNVLAANQTITYNYAVPSVGLSALEFLAASSDTNETTAGTINGDATAPYVPPGTPVSGVYCFDSNDPAAYCPAVGTITYTDQTQQTYLLTVPDWIMASENLAALSVDGINNPSGSDLSWQWAQIYPFSVPLTPGKTVQSVTLPDVGNTVANRTSALHIFGMSARNTTAGTVEADGSTVAAPTGQTWTGAWGSPIEGQFGVDPYNTFSNVTTRLRITPSVSGSTIRITLGDTDYDGDTPLVIGHATIAHADYTNMTDLTFSGSPGVTIPDSGMIYSDPIPFNVTAGQQLIVSLAITNEVASLPFNINSDAYTSMSANGSGDHTRDTSESAFAGPGTWSDYCTDILTNLDVVTSGIDTQAILGTDYFNSGAMSSLKTDLADGINSTSTTHGLLAETIEANSITIDRERGGAAAVTRVDRDILDQPGITSVILTEGLTDLVNDQTADTLLNDGYTPLLTYLQANNISVITSGLTPCDGATAWDGCTSTVDGYRTATNAWLSNNPLGMGPWSTPKLFYIDPDSALGVPDTSNGETKLNAAADSGDHFDLSPAGYGALASAYLGPQDTWQLDDGVNPDGSIDTTITTAEDNASNAKNPYLLNNPTTGQNPLTLTGNATWTNDPTRGGVLTLDGTNSDAEADGPVLNTSASFTVSTWVNMASLPTNNATIAAQDGTVDSAFYLQYNYAHASAPGWEFAIAKTDTTNPALGTIYAAGATTGWTHLVGVYNAAAHTAQFYVNGVLAGTLTNITTWAATGVFTVGRALYNGNPTDYVPGSVSDVQAWNYALSPDQITALYQQIQ